MIAPPAVATATATEVASVARLVAAAGLAEGFGHVSARLAGGGFAITSTAPLGSADEGSVIALAGARRRRRAPRGLPLEAPAHAAIYAARPDVGAIVRVHPPSVVVAGLSGELPPVTHGLAGLSGEVALLDDPQLVDGPERAAAAAAALGAADCLVMRANGALAVGPDLATACVRAWFLEERARVWLAAGRPDGLEPGRARGAGGALARGGSARVGVAACGLRRAGGEVSETVRRAGRGRAGRPERRRDAS